jgi:osmotically inducible lipoprotein OsmB
VVSWGAAPGEERKFEPGAFYFARPQKPATTSTRTQRESIMTTLHKTCLAAAIAACAVLSACGTNMEQRAATGAATGLIVAGPVGAAVGAVAGAVVDKADESDGKKGN